MRRFTAALTILLATTATASLPPPRPLNTTSRVVPGAVNVHLIPHSHDDVGWLKGPASYMFGAKDIGILPSLYYASGDVFITIESVVSSLLRNPDRTFVVVEQYFFRKWWSNTSPETQQIARQLVNSGQLQFASGGLVMPDEAGPILREMLDQVTAGNRFLYDAFGPAAAPRVASQLDPFGHSAAHASLFASPLAGNIGVFFARMDYEEAELRGSTKTADFAWQASPSLGPSATTAGIFGVMDGYGNPDGLCFDSSIECYPFQDPISDDVEPDAEDRNVDAYVTLAVQAAMRYAQAYPADPDGTAHVPWMMGSDFQYVDAHMNYFSMDRLISWGNAVTNTTRVNFMYSTPATYAAARISSSQTPLSLRQGDIFPCECAVCLCVPVCLRRARHLLPLPLPRSHCPLPHPPLPPFSFADADGPHSVWTGYFTSRPALKGYHRESTAVFQAAKQLQLWAGGAGSAGGSWADPLWLLETSVGVSCHHDAVAGTSKQAVAFDYARRLAKGRATADAAISDWLNGLVGTGAGTPLLFASCDLGANATICPALEAAAAGDGSPGSASPVALVLYNPQGHDRVLAPVRLPVALVSASGAASWRVVGSDGSTPLQAQLLPLSAADVSLRTQYYNASAFPAGGSTGSMSWLAFLAPRVPAMGYTVLFLSPVSSGEDAPETVTSRVVTLDLASSSTLSSSASTLTNGAVTLTFDPATGLLSSFASTSPGAAGAGTAVPVSQTLLFYRASTGDAADGQAAGAYIFRVTDNTTAEPVSTNPNGAANVTLVVGPVVSEARQVLSPWATQVIRLWANATVSFDVEWTVGPIPWEDLVGKEVISRFTCGGWQTNGTWRTDSNGWETQPRVRNQRSQYKLNVTEPVAQNLFPVNTAISTADTAASSGSTLVVVTDRTQAGGSMADGALELLVHRRLFADDSRGVLESLSEPGVNGQGLIVRGTHTVVLADAAHAAAAHKAAVQASTLPLLWRAAVLPSGTAPAQWAAGKQTGFSGLADGALPPNVELMTVHSWNATAVLVRLAHLYEAGEDPVLSLNATVALATLFATGSPSVTAAVEMTIVGSMPLADVQPVTYKIAAQDQEAARRRFEEEGAGRVFKDAETGSAVYYDEITLPVVPAPPSGPGLTVTVAPMSIRTFLLTLAG
jgi:lysosomal alpha-mannosidase